MSSHSPRLAVALVAIASVFVIMFGIKASAVILNPILLALVITITVLPLPNKLSQRGLPGWLSLVLTVLAVVGVLALVIALVLVGITKLSVDLSSYADDLAQQAAETATWLETSSFSSVLGLSSPNSDAISKAGSALLGWIGSSLTVIVMTLLIFIFMIAAAVSLPRSTRKGMQASYPVIERVSSLTEDVRRYVSIMTLINFLVGLGDTILLWILGVNYAILWGILAWLLGYIPTIGFWFALIPPTLLAWAEFGPTTALIVFIGYVVINGTVQNFIQPKMMGERLNISPVVVFVSLFIWGWLLGGIGAILAVPLTLLIFVFLDSFEGTRWVVELLRLSPDRKSAEHVEARARLGGIWDRIRTAAETAVGTAAQPASREKSTPASNPGPSG